MAQTRKTQGAHKNSPAETAPAPTSTHMTQSAEKSLSAEDKQDLPETASDSNAEEVSKLPERRAQEGFTAMLAQIAEEPEFDEADRSIGNYDFHDEEWESWKAGPAKYEDEYEGGAGGHGSKSDGTQSVATATGTRTVRLPPWRRNKLSKPQTSKPKAAGVKRKHWDWDLNSDGNTEPDSESEVESECCVVSLELGSFMCTDLLHRADFTYQVDVSSKAKDICKVITQSSTTKWPDFEESIAKY